jgi:phosphatidylserine/phosphatidylglycerophosphate/cardiolipin synthase-like enzyme
VQRSVLLTFIFGVGAFVACGGPASSGFQETNGNDAGPGGGGNNGGDQDGGGTMSGGDAGTGTSGGDGGSATDAGGGGNITGSTSVSILVYPNGNKAAELIAAINNAKTSVYMTMYEIDDTNVIGAITAAKGRGLDVKVVLDGSSTTKSNNQSAYTSFNGYVKWSSSAYTFTHEKCVMIDHKEAWIMTANAEKSVPQYNREYLAIDDDAADVTEAEAIFNADYAGQAITPSGDLVVANTNAQPDLVALIKSAQKSVDIEDEEFSDNGTNGVTDAVVAAAKKGITVRVVVAGGTPTPAQTTSLDAVKAAGGSVYVSSVTSSGGCASNPYIHAKSILVDCATGTCASGFVGSENMTTGSLLYNRELGVIITDGTQLAKIETAMTTDFGNATKQ